MGRFSFLCLFLIACSLRFTSSVVYADELSLVVAQSTSLQISPSLRVENSPGSKPGSIVLCQRVHIHGLSRLKDLRKYGYSLKVKVLHENSGARPPNIEICFHRNLSLAIGMCPQGKWDKLVKGAWMRSMSPFDHKVLDVRMAGPSLEVIEVSIEEEFFLHRIVFLVLGTVIMSLASFLSKSLVFYYSSAMAVGIILVILMVLFQGMKLLPTGRKSSLAVFLYSSLVGLGSFLLRFLPRLLRSILMELGISEDMYNPLALFLLVFLVIAGAWLGFWVVRRFVLTDDGLVDTSVAHFVAWSIRVFAAVMILQSSLDSILAAEALFCGVLISSMFRRITKQRLIRRLYKSLCRVDKSSRRQSQTPNSSLVEDSYDEDNKIQRSDNYKSLKPQMRLATMAACSTPDRGLNRTPLSQMSDSEAYYSSFHRTPKPRKFSKDKWNKFTKDSTRNALEELVSSPDFSKWAVAHADRITLIPKKDTPDQRHRLFPWFQF